MANLEVYLAAFVFLILHTDRFKFLKKNKYVNDVIFQKCPPLVFFFFIVIRLTFLSNSSIPFQFKQILDVCLKKRKQTSKRYCMYIIENVSYS